jgi:CheY-like chemotaxis protein
VADGFASGRAALEAIPKLDPDVIISDILMPAPNGWDLAREVRKLEAVLMALVEKARAL